MTTQAEEFPPQRAIALVVEHALSQLPSLARATAQAQVALDDENAASLCQASSHADEVARALFVCLDELAQAPSSIPATDRRIAALRAHAKNLTASLARAAEAAEQGSWTDVRDRLELEVAPMLDGLAQRLKREQTLAEGPESTRREVDAMIESLRRAATPPEGTTYPFEASIVVCAYNKLDYTRLTVDTILEHTDLASGRYELILVDNGSSDGTRAYFHSIPGARVVELDENTGPLGGFAAGWLATRGEFIASTANDVVLTERWLEQLLLCARSDPRIAFVVPTCNSISNRQATPVEYGDDFQEMQRFAAMFNRTDPNLWEDRCRLMPFSAVLPRRLIDLGFRMDPVYAMGEFVDDDQSTVMRRAGLRQVLARDTFVHHFGSVTLGEAQRAESSLERMRGVYRSKWGLDAWDGCRVVPELSAVLAQGLPPIDARLLVVEPLFGDTLRDVLHSLSSAGHPAASSDALLVDPRYLEDAEALVERVFRHPEACPRGHYDLVLLGAELEDLSAADPFAFVSSLIPCLRPGGRLLARIRNAQSLDDLRRRLSPNLGQEEHAARAAVTSVAVPTLLTQLRAQGWSAFVVPVHDSAGEEAARPIVELLISLLPQATRNVANWLTPAFVLVVEKPGEP